MVFFFCVVDRGKLYWQLWYKRVICSFIFLSVYYCANVFKFLGQFVYFPAMFFFLFLCVSDLVFNYVGKRFCIEWELNMVIFIPESTFLSVLMGMPSILLHYTTLSDCLMLFFASFWLSVDALASSSYWLAQKHYCNCAWMHSK